MSVRVRQIDSAADRRKFVRVPWLTQRSDPKWIPPLMSDVLDTMSPRKNPFFEHGSVALFIAERENGESSDGPRCWNSALSPQ